MLEKITVEIEMKFVKIPSTWLVMMADKFSTGILLIARNSLTVPTIWGSRDMKSEVWETNGGTIMLTTSPIRPMTKM